MISEFVFAPSPSQVVYFSLARGIESAPGASVMLYMYTGVMMCTSVIMTMP